MKNKWTLSKISDLSEKTIIITGANSGLGYESAKVFAGKGATTIITARTIEKGEYAKSEILKTFPAAKIDVMILDLMDLNSVHQFAVSFKDKYDRLDILLNNAGIMMTPYKLSKQGFESQMATNHLGHFALTGLLIDVLIKTPESRIINVSSLAHKQGKIRFDDLFFENEKNYSPMKGYGRSKLSNLLFTYELQRFLSLNKKNTIVLAAHPGASHTNLGNHLVGSFLYKILWPLAKIMTQKPSTGALSQIRAAVDPNVSGGEYFGPSGFFQMGGYPVIVKSNSKSHDIDAAQKLWKESEKASGIYWNTKIK